MIGGDIQWSRYAEVSFTNYNSGVITTIKSSEIDNNNNIIGEGLRIAFEYSKSDDQGYNSPNGKIVIYGLTEKTFNAVGERLRCEIEVKAGYLESKLNAPKKLFYAVLMNKKYEISDGISVSTFEVLGDFIEKVIAEKMSMNLPKATLMDIMVSIASSMGKAFEMSINGDQADQELLANYITKWVVSPYGYSFASTPQQELKRLKDAYGIIYRIEKDAVVFGLSDKSYNWHLDGARQISAMEKKQADTTLIAENKVAPEVVETKPIAGPEKKIDLVKTHALVLSSDTGLIGSPVVSTEIEDKNYEEGVAEGEEVWSKKQQKAIIDKKTGKQRVDKKTGKAKFTKKPKSYKVARRTVTAKAFLNAMIQFNSQITIITPSGIADGTYRVRSMKFTGDTDAGGPWFMELELNGEGYNKKDLET
ncbi:baseplate hub [Acinetobacter phage vB_AbaM_P1]|nr:baseplate hub [Acinetobacter phage vB_AbaM_P1]WAX22542.1 primase [Acinetobacter phage vB_AbaP_HB01]WAX22709.1 hypothetical protein [Acinetobacter phage vB_AbaP_HB01]